MRVSKRKAIQTEVMAADSFGSPRKKGRRWENPAGSQQQRSQSHSRVSARGLASPAYKEMEGTAQPTLGILRPAGLNSAWRIPSGITASKADHVQILLMRPSRRWSRNAFAGLSQPPKASQEEGHWTRVSIRREKKTYKILTPSTGQVLIKQRQKIWCEEGIKAGQRTGWQLRHSWKLKRLLNWAKSEMKE